MAQQSIKHESNGDMDYLKARHRLIPVADRLMREQFQGKKNITREERDYTFHRHMTELAVKAGISDPGNLVVFDAVEIPSGTFNTNL